MDAEVMGDWSRVAHGGAGAAWSAMHVALVPTRHLEEPPHGLHSGSDHTPTPKASVALYLEPTWRREILRSGLDPAAPMCAATPTEQPCSCPAPTSPATSMHRASVSEGRRTNLASAAAAVTVIGGMRSGIKRKDWVAQWGCGVGWGARVQGMHSSGKGRRDIRQSLETDPGLQELENSGSRVQVTSGSSQHRAGQGVWEGLGSKSKIKDDIELRQKGDLAVETGSHG